MRGVFRVRVHHLGEVAPGRPGEPPGLPSDTYSTAVPYVTVADDAAAAAAKVLASIRESVRGHRSAEEVPDERIPLPVEDVEFIARIDVDDPPPAA